MRESMAVSIATQLASASPLLLVYLAGMILALVLWQRSPRASLFCLLGMGLLLVMAFVSTFATIFVIHSSNARGWSSKEIGVLLSAIGVAGSIIRAGAMVLLLAAVFAGRQKTRPVLTEKAPLSDPFPTRPTDRGITRSPGGEAFTTEE